MEESNFSRRDAEVLSRVFNPEMPFVEDEPDDAGDLEAMEEEEDEQELEIRRREREAVRCAEAEELTSALDQLNDLIISYPDRPSLFNNRAQILQLLGDRKGALADACQAVRLFGVDSVEQLNADSVAEMRRAPTLRRHTAAQALTQLGVLLRVDECQEKALRCFQAAAQLGSEFAKEMVVKMNPYSALCGTMLAGVFDRLQRGEPELE